MANEIHDANGNYVGYVNSRGEIIDSGRKGTLSNATANAGRKMAARNPAERRTSAERKEAKTRSRRNSARRTRAARSRS